MQCSGSVTFWYGSPCGSGSLDPYLWLTVPDPDLDADSALVVSELQYVTSQWSLKKNISNFFVICARGKEVDSAGWILSTEHRTKIAVDGKAYYGKQWSCIRFFLLSSVLWSKTNWFITKLAKVKWSEVVLF
jgi:hypothetical protein